MELTLNPDCYYGQVKVPTVKEMVLTVSYRAIVALEAHLITE